MTVRTCVRLACWQIMASTVPAAMPATKVGSVGFFITIRTMTTSTGSSRKGFRLKVEETVPRMSS